MGEMCTDSESQHRTESIVNEETIARIAREHLDIETLKTRSSDSLDFHECAVWCIRAALNAAFEAGAAAARGANETAGCEA